MSPRSARGTTDLKPDFGAPGPYISWTTDLFDNAITTAQFDAPTDDLMIDSTAIVAPAAEPCPVFDVAASAEQHPFFSSRDEIVDLGSLAWPQYFELERPSADWASSFICGGETDTLSAARGPRCGDGGPDRL